VGRHVSHVWGTPDLRMPRRTYWDRLLNKTGTTPAQGHTTPADADIIWHGRQYQMQLNILHIVRICDDVMLIMSHCAVSYLGRTLDTHYGGGVGDIWLDDLGCSGSEETLGSCSHLGWGVHNCGHDEDVSVACREEGK